MRITDKHVFFWNGIYSQWHLADMTIDRVVYNSCEQYMMHQKALLFGDSEIAEEIMKEKNPREQKRFGRQIKNFSKEVWDKNCFAIVYEGNYAKFTQNSDLKKELLATGDRILVEASPLDNIWGIGMGQDDEGVDDPSFWLGLNLLGFAITTVRNQIK